VTFATRYDIPPAGGAEERETAVNQFLADAALQSDQDELKEEKNAVRLMTVHASKGLEFDHVFITGLEQDLFPHSRFGEDERTEEKAEEERRLFYVALTRARKKIFLTYANVRTIFGARQVNLPSEFIFDIDEELLQAEAISNFEYPISKKIEY
ncbi:MAG: 3'-5' exonuclease, partial [Patescibacteria group bacterium]